MGSWTETCGISNLPITYGDPCILVYLRAEIRTETESISRRVYPYDAWSPATIPLRGTYADYGRIELNPDNNPDLVSCTETWVEKHRRKNAWESNRNSLGQDYGFVCELGNPVVPQLFREDAWDSLLSLPPGEYGLKSYEQYRTLLAEEDRGSLYRRFFATTASPRYPKLCHTYPEFAEVAWIDYMLGVLRKSWSPTSGSGSQGEDWDLHAQVNLQFSKLAREAYLRQLEDY